MGKPKGASGSRGKKQSPQQPKPGWDARKSRTGKGHKAVPTTTTDPMMRS